MFRKPAVQIAPQLLDLAAWTFGEHADRTHTDDLAGWVDDGGNLDPTPGEADVNVRYPLSDLIWLNSVRARLAVDAVESLAEVVG